MAKAPRPGVGQRKERVRAAQRILRITVKGESHDLAPNNLSFEERARVRKQTGGMSIESYLGDETSFGEDSIVVVWWLARRADGEKALALNTVWREWKELVDAGLGAEDVELEEITPDDADDDSELSPEA